MMGRSIGLVMAWGVVGACSGGDETMVDAPPMAGDAAGDAAVDAGPEDPRPIVPGGTFFRNYDVATDGTYASMAAPATVTAFRLDRFEVTVARFRAFVDAGKGTKATAPAAGAGAHPNIAASGWTASFTTSLATTSADLRTALVACGDTSTWTDTAGANEMLPINCVTWYDAFAFCAWDGGFLPTQTEWNLAASGGDQQRAYPWSVPAGSLELTDPHANANTFQLPLAVGSRRLGDGRYGHADLAGNVAEWTLDSNAGDPLPCMDCAALAVDTARVIRGGPLGPLRSAGRVFARVDTGVSGFTQPRNTNIGFRCARPM